MSSVSDNCPSCQIDLNEVWSDGRIGRREIGMEIPGVYDGVLYWFCPVCGYAWARDFGNWSPARTAKSEEYAERHNKKRLRGRTNTIEDEAAYLSEVHRYDDLPDLADAL